MLSRHVKVIMLDGPAKGEKRKFPYELVKADSAAQGEKLAKSHDKADPPAAPAARASTEPSATPAAKAIAGAAASSEAAA